MADCAIVFSTVIATAATVATAFILQSHGVPLLQRAERSQRAARVEQRAALLNQQAWGCKLFGARGDRVYWPQRGGTGTRPGGALHLYSLAHEKVRERQS